MPLPWDPIFQQKWGAFIQALAARYGNNPNLAYVVMGGPGRRQEAYFCFTDYDMDYFNNTLGGLPNWEAGVEWIIDQYGTYFPNTPFMLAMGDPIPTSDGDASLEAVVRYGMAQHPGNHFVEVYPTDCDNPLLAPVLTTWGALLTTTPPIPLPPTGLTATATSSSTINLGWINLAINEIGQRIERSVGSNANYAFLTNVGTTD